jgi:hypothetical protein
MVNPYTDVEVNKMPERNKKLAVVNLLYQFRNIRGNCNGS